MDTLMEYALTVYSHPDEHEIRVFDKDLLEEQEEEYEKWKETFHHTSIVPLGLKRGDYVLKDLAMDMDEEEDSEIEEDDDDEELDQVIDLYEGDSDPMEGESMQDIHPLNLDESG